MASHPRSEPLQQQPPHASPYCNDPNCEYCRQLRELQDSIRSHELPSAGTASDDQ